MLLENKNAVVYGAAGAVGSAVAEAFAREGAHVFLTGRDLARVQRLAEKINDAGRRDAWTCRSTPPAFIASDRASAMTATIANLSAGSITD